MDDAQTIQHLKELLGQCDALRTKLQTTMDHLSRHLREKEPNQGGAEKGLAESADARAGHPAARAH